MLFWLKSKITFMGELLNQFILLIAFGVVMFISSEIVVRQASRISRIFGLSGLAIGFLFLSLIANMPELSVFLSSFTKGQIDISLGNIFGTVIVNSTFIFGLMALVFSVKISKSSVRHISPLIFATAVIPLLLAAPLPRQILGILLIGTFFGFVMSVMKGRKKKKDPVKIIKTKKLPSIVLHVALGISGIFISSWFMVSAASRISDLTGIGSTIIGATIVSIMTSMPDIFLSIIAIRKGYFGMALGEIFGSNLTALSFVLGLALMFSSPSGEAALYPVFTGVLLMSALLFWLFSGRGVAGVPEGIIMLIFYAIFVLTALGVGFKLF